MQEHTEHTAHLAHRQGQRQRQRQSQTQTKTPARKQDEDNTRQEEANSTLRWPQKAAQCRAELPHEACAETLAPSWMRCAHVSAGLWHALRVSSR
eukprot:972975-Rhodomonas_salina.1